MKKLLEIMRRLRAPDGCPWDREQSHQSLRPYLLEEAAEAVDAIESGETAQIVDELGDVLLQVAFHSVIAEDNNTFTYDDVEASIVNKLIRRHPHVFGDAKVDSANEVVRNWQAIKSQEQKLSKRIPAGLPTLMRAAAYVKSIDSVDIAELSEKTKNLEPTNFQLADFMLALIAFAQSHGIDLEMALRDRLSTLENPDGC